MKTVFEPSLSVNFSFHKNNPEINNAEVLSMKRIVVKYSFEKNEYIKYRIEKRT